MYRRRYDLEKDPEVKTKYDSRIESSETSIVGVLKAHQAGETLLNLIKEEGGWNKFAKSNRSVTLNDGTNVTASQLADNVMQQLPLGDRRVIDAAMVEQINTARDKDNYFKEQQQSATKFFEQREQEQQKQAETQKKNVEQVQARVQDWLKQESENNDWLKEEPVPETAEPATKAEFQERNQYKGKLKALLKKSLAETSIDGALQITKDSVQMFWEKRRAEKAEAQVEALRKQLEAKQKEIDKFHSASRTLPKSAGSLASRAASDLPEKKEFKSLEDTFDAIASGKISRSEILMNANESE